VRTADFDYRFPDELIAHAGVDCLVQPELGYHLSLYIVDPMSLAARAHLRPVGRQECNVIERARATSWVVGASAPVAFETLWIIRADGDDVHDRKRGLIPSSSDRSADVPRFAQ
jgi:hypothetical protein